MVIEIIGLDRSLKVAALMIGCWSKDIWTSVLSEMGQGKLMGLSAVLGFLLSSSRSANHISRHYLSLTHPTHTKIQRPTSALVSLNLFFVMILTPPYAYQPMFYV